MDQNEIEDLDILDERKEFTESPDQTHDSQVHRNQDPFTALMFGPMTANQQSESFSPSQHLQNKQENHNYIDLEELMVHIDTLYSSYQGLKPLFQKFYPFIEQFLKKK